MSSSTGFEIITAVLIGLAAGAFWFLLGFLIGKHDKEKEGSPPFFSHDTPEQAGEEARDSNRSNYRKYTHDSS